MSRSGEQKTLVIICGPPAVGKMTVGSELSRLTGLPLFHNHLSIEAILPVFDFGTPEFNRFVGGLRRSVFEEVVESSKPGIIFTMVWGFGLDSELSFIESLTVLFESRGGRAAFVELSADLQVRLKRNRHPSRLDAKPSKRDVEASEERLLGWESQFEMNTSLDDPFPFENHIRIDNSDLSPEATAQIISETFGLGLRADG